MVRRNLPPFAALRVFDTVSRTLHFTQAAEELGLTQAAVSRQVKALEDELGVRLINRRAGGNSLTSAGAKLSIGLREGLDMIAQSIGEVSSSQRQTLTVSVAPFFSAVWLTPRLAGFARLHPGIDVRLHHAYRPPNYECDEIDLGINWGDGDWPNASVEKVFDGCLTPVCSRQAAGTVPPAPEPAHLLNLPLYCEFAVSDWTGWFNAAGIHADVPALNVTRVDDTHAMLSATLETGGFALMFKSLITDIPYSGQLVQPFAETVDTGNHYFLSRPSKQPLSATGKKFRDWIMSELSPQEGSG
ncbi:MAG: LysR substrate-binding domain-containing protein [Pseudomonadota bacterium]